MALAAMLTAVAEYVGDVLVNDCGRDLPERVLRHHGHAVPDEFCGDKGILSVWWEPNMRAKDPNSPCTGWPVVNISARWVVCWKLPDYDELGVTQHDAIWDADSGILADAAECVQRALMRLSCADVQGAKALAVLELAPSNSFRFLGTNPAGPLGGVAGVVWRIETGLKEASTS